MPIKMPATDEGKLNMTPMIDIVFNLVTFFMLTLDMSRKELAALDLPRANKGIEDKPFTPKNQKEKDDNTRYVINLLANGNIMLKGEEYPLRTIKLDNKTERPATPQEQHASLEKLKAQLRELTRNPALRDETGASKVMVLVRGDRTTQWKYVQWIMQICAEQKIWKIHFGVEGPPKE